MGSETSKDVLRALVTLADGRKAWRDGRGRYRDAENGRFLRSMELTESGGDEDDGKEGGAREQARRHLLEAVKALGLDAKSAEDAGARATAAAKLVAQETGLLESEEGEGGETLELDAETAERLIAALSAEAERRTRQPD